MSKILDDFAPSTLVKAIEDNTIQSIETSTRWSRMELHDDPDMAWTASDIPYFLFNLLLPNKTASSDPGEVLDAALSRAISRNVPMGLWEGPFNPFPDLGSHLEEKGFVHAAQLTGMAVDLLALEGRAPAPDDLTVTKVDSSGKLETWCQMMTAVSEFPDVAAAAWLEMYQDIGIQNDPQWNLYLGHINGRPLSTSALFLGAGVADIHGVTAIPELRGKGIGTATTLSPLLEARSKGYRIGVLYASEMTVNLYRKIGFQEYCRANIYLWQPA